MCNFHKFFFIWLLNIILFNAYGEDSHSPIWSYQGEHGPAYWGNLNDAYKLCSRGKKQSPIDIKAVDTLISKTLPSVKFAYKSSYSFRISNTGHNIEVPYKNGSKFIMGENEYELLNIQFHSPAPHILNSKQSELEIDLVHQNQAGQILTVGLMVNKGNMNYALYNFIKDIPNTAYTFKDVKGKKINPLDLFPETGGYYIYSGSLTMPPCTENVTWVILHTPIEASIEQIMELTKVYRMNARPTQPLNGRKIQRKI